MKRLSLILFIIICLNGCTFFTGNNNVLKIKGSETMLDLINRLVSRFVEENPNISFVVEAGGTAAGIRALVEKEIMISTASRNLEPEEIKLVSERHGTVGVTTSIAKDALCIYVNKKNPIESITQQQIKNIFLGRITNWKEIGWIDKPINVYIRNNSSGTLQLFQKLVLENESFTPLAKPFDSISSLQNAVENDEFSITFSGFVKGTNCKIVSLDDIFPNNTNVISGYYPLTRYLQLHTLNPPEGATKIFINWVLSKKGQNIIEEEGFFPLFEYLME